jgi:cell division protein ZapA
LKKEYEIRILGQELTVLSDSGDEHVDRVVKYVADKVEEIGRQSNRTNNLGVAILTALNIADEYMKIKGFKEDVCSQLETRSEKLIHLIDGVR